VAECIHQDVGWTGVHGSLWFCCLYWWLYTWWWACVWRRCLRGHLMTWGRPSSRSLTLTLWCVSLSVDKSLNSDWPEFDNSLPTHPRYSLTGCRCHAGYCAAPASAIDSVLCLSVCHTGYCEVPASAIDSVLCLSVCHAGYCEVPASAVDSVVCLSVCHAGYCEVPASAVDSVLCLSVCLSYWVLWGTG